MEVRSRSPKFTPNSSRLSLNSQIRWGVALLGEPLTLQLVLALTGVAVGIVLVNRR